MHRATKAFAAAGVPYVGPAAAVMERCYDKFEAGRQVAAAGVHCPETVLADDAARIAPPRILKPRRGSDSIGVRLLGEHPVPSSRRNDAHIVQAYVHGAELTVAVLRGEVGMPLRIELPEGVPYSFLHKYLLRPARGPVGDAALAQRVRSIAAQASRVLGVDWAARIDLMHESSSDRLVFLECDVAPLVSADSAFAASLAAGGMARRRQLQMLLGEAS
jgi:D-alanine-D-alanine ligase